MIDLMTRGFFITGTGTGVGKTFVTALLAEEARTIGRRVFAFKPIETGCSRGIVASNADRLVGEDQERLARAAGDWQQGELRNLYCFERPLAPLAAARVEQRTIDLDRIDEVFRRGCAQSTFVLVEGAGGWRVPITTTADMSTLAKRVGLPVLVVAAAGLGTINHSVLTIEAVRRDGCVVTACLLSVRPEDDVGFARDNAEEIQRLSAVRVGLCSGVSRETLRELVA